MKILILVVVVVVILNIPTSESFFFANFLITLSLPICGKVDIRALNLYSAHVASVFYTGLYEIICR